MDLQNQEPFTEPQNKCIHLAQQYSKHLDGCIGTVSGLQGHHHLPQKSKTEWGKTGLFSKGTAQIHFINGIGSI
jgi:hypothetical protein